MLINTLIILFCITLPILVTFIFILSSMRTNSDREKTSPFECGFDPSHSSRIPFSMRFFLLAIIFLVFDIEIVLLMPIPMLEYTKHIIIYGAYLFLMILLLGLLHEWNQGSLKWTN